jgi:hypothetical protein
MEGQQCVHDSATWTIWIMFCIDDDVREQVAKMFGRTSKVLDEDVQIVKKWLQTQAHLPELMGK